MYPRVLGVLKRATTTKGTKVHKESLALSQRRRATLCHATDFGERNFDKKAFRSWRKAFLGEGVRACGRAVPSRSYLGGSC